MRFEFKLFATKGIDFWSTRLIVSSWLIKPSKAMNKSKQTDSWDNRKEFKHPSYIPHCLS